MLNCSLTRWVQLYSLDTSVQCSVDTILLFGCKCTLCGQGRFTMVLMISFMLQINSWQPKPLAMESGGNL